MVRRLRGVAAEIASRQSFGATVVILLQACESYGTFRFFSQVALLTMPSRRKVCAKKQGFAMSAAIFLDLFKTGFHGAQQRSDWSQSLRSYRIDRARVRDHGAMEG